MIDRATVDLETVDRASWMEARRALLAEEKAFSKARDRLSAVRRSLPLVRIDKPYTFETENGPKALVDLFEGRDQLVVYHFMFGPDWDEGCPSCSFWADSFNGTDVHLAARGTTFLCVSNAPLDRLLAYRRRMGWSFRWVSAVDAAFSEDFGVTFKDGKPGPAGGYNYTDRVPSEEMPGLSVFLRLNDGSVAHSYSTYGRGLDLINSAYNLLDLTPSGRGEEGLPNPQAWVRRRDQY